MLLTVLVALAAALTAASSTKAARSALEAYLEKHPATIGVLVKKLRWRVQTVQDAEDLAAQSMEVAIRRERTGKGRRWVEGGPYPPLVHLIYIARLLLRLARKKGQSFQTLPLDEPDILESEDRNVEEMALENRRAGRARRVPAAAPGVLQARDEGPRHARHPRQRLDPQP